MIGHIIRWELASRRRSIVWWTVASIGLSLMILALYPSIRDQAAQMNQVINQLPAGLRELKAGTSGVVDVGEPRSFLNSQLLYATLPLIWIILAITRGSSILGKDEDNRVLELLLARPVARRKLLFAKAASFVIECTLIFGLTALLIVGLSPVFGLHVGIGQLGMGTAYTALFCLSFGWVAFCLKAASQMARRIAIPVSVMLSFGGYVVASLSGLTTWLKYPVKLVPFHYFTPLDPLNGRTPRGLVVYLLMVFIIGSTIALVGFNRRDIE